MDTEKIYTSVYRSVITVVIYSLFVLFFHNYIGIGEVKIYHFLVGAFVTAYATLIVLTKVKWKIIIASITIFLFIPLLILYGPNKVWDAVLLIGIIPAVLSFLLECLIERIPALKVVGILLIIASFIVSKLIHNEIYHMTVVFSFTYLILVYVEFIRNIRTPKSLDYENTSQSNSRSKAYMVWIMPVILVYIVALSLTPAPKNPYSWPVIRKVYTEVRTKLSAIYHQYINDAETFSLSFSGINDEDNSDVGDSVLDTNNYVMTIRADFRQNTNIYLAGKTYDSFDGKEWIKKDDRKETVNNLDVIETLTAFKDSELEHKEDYLVESTLTIHYGNINTQFLFKPLKTYRVNAEQNLPYNEKGGDYLFDKKQGFGSEYHTRYVQMNLQDVGFNEFIENTNPTIDEEDWNYIISRYYPNSDKGITYEDELANIQYIKDNYAEDINLSDETKAFINEITADCETPLERLYAIERELSSYKYTKTPEVLPRNIDSSEEFVDYLLTNKSGYCTYYATTFVILARSEGFPARYVEGYAVPVRDRNNILVTGSMAHAWAEVYIDGLGWIPFEPTPGYGKRRYRTWETGTWINSSNPGDKYIDYANQVSDVKDLPNEIETEETKHITRADIDRYISFAMLIVSALIFIILIIAIERFISTFFYQRLSLDKKYSFEERRLNILLSGVNLKRKDNETLREFSIRVKEYFERKGIETGMDSIVAREPMFYGGETVKDELIIMMQSEQKPILRYLWTYHKGAWLRVSLLLYFVVHR